MFICGYLFYVCAPNNNQVVFIISYLYDAENQSHVTMIGVLNVKIKWN